MANLEKKSFDNPDELKTPEKTNAAVDQVQVKKKSTRFKKFDQVKNQTVTQYKPQ